MSHTITLGIGTDTVDLVGTASPGLRGPFLLQGYTIGKPNSQGTREINITVNVQWTSTVDAASDAIHKVESYLVRTASLMDLNAGNMPLNSDETWPGAVLSIKPHGSSRTLYWEVVDGKIDLPNNYLDIPLGSGKVLGMKLTLLVKELAKGARVILNNLIPRGDFSEEFQTSPIKYLGYTFSSNFSVVQDVYDIGKRICAQYSGNGAVGTITTPAFTGPVAGDKLFPDFDYMVDSGGDGMISNCTVYIDGSNDGTTWSQLTPLFATLTTNQANFWLKNRNLYYTITSTKTYYRVRYTVVGSARVWFSRLAAWLNPVGTVSPTEYVSSPYGNRSGAIKIYNVQGDVEVPVSLTITNTSGQNQQGVLVGGYQYHAGYDNPLKASDIQLGPKYFNQHADTFTRSASTSGPGTMESPGDGTGWVQNQGTWGIDASGRLYCVTAANFDMITDDLGSTDYQFSFTHTGQWSTTTPYTIISPVLGYVDASNYLIISFSNPYYGLWLRSGGTSTNLIQPTTAQTDGSTHGHTIVKNGTDLWCYMDGTLMWYYNLTGVQANILASTKIGFRHDLATGAGSYPPRIDNYQAQPLIGGTLTGQYGARPVDYLLSNGSVGTITAPSNYTVTRDQRSRMFRRMLFMSLSQGNIITTGTVKIAGESRKISRQSTDLGQWTYTTTRPPDYTTNTDFMLVELDDAYIPAVDVPWSESTKQFGGSDTSVSLNYDTPWKTVPGSQNNSNQDVSGTVAVWTSFTKSAGTIPPGTWAYLMNNYVSGVLAPMSGYRHISATFVASQYTSYQPALLIRASNNPAVSSTMLRLRFDADNGLIRLEQVSYNVAGADSVTVLQSWGCGVALTYGNNYRLEVIECGDCAQVYFEGSRIGVFGMASYSGNPYIGIQAPSTSWPGGGTNVNLVNIGPVLANNAGGVSVGEIVDLPSNSFGYADLGATSSVYQFKLFNNDRRPLWGVKASSTDSWHRTQEYSSSNYGIDGMYLVPSTDKDYVNHYHAIMYRSRNTSLNGYGVFGDTFTAIVEYTPRYRNVN